MMKIRPMSVHDYDEVHEFWSSTPGVGMRSLDDSPDGIAKFLRRNPNTNFIAEEDQRLIGVILCGHDGRRGYIYHTAVKPDRRRKGIGRALVDAALEALKRENINKAALVVFKTNDQGNEFWKSVGFEQRDDLLYRNISLNSDNF